MKRTIWKVMVATPFTFIALVVLIGRVGGAYYHLKVNSEKPISEIWSTFSWRAQIYLNKASGQIPELSWSEASLWGT